MLERVWRKGTLLPCWWECKLVQYYGEQYRGSLKNLKLGGDICEIVADFHCHSAEMGLPRWPRGKEPSCQWRRPKRRGFSPWVGKIPWRRTWQLTPVFLPGEPHGLRSPAGYMGLQRVRHDWSDLAHTHGRNQHDTKVIFLQLKKIKITQFMWKKKIKTRTTKWPSHPTPGHIPWESHNWRRCIHPSVHCSTVYSSQGVEPAQLSIGRWTERRYGAHL